MIAARRVEDADGTIRLDWTPPAKEAIASLIQGGAIQIGGAIEPTNGCNAASVRRALADWPRGEPVFVEIDSTGGNLAEGVAIYLALKCDPRHVTVRIPKQAASAATVIVCAGDRIEIAETARFEIHDSRILDTKGWALTSARLQVLSDTLAEADAQIRDILGTRCKCSRGWLADAMRQERTFTGHEAVNAGFADAVIPPLDASAAGKAATT